MQEIIVPDDGLAYVTGEGEPVMQISFPNEMTVLQLFSRNASSTILLGCHDAESAVLLKSGNRSLGLTVNLEQNEIRLIGENGRVTHLIYTTDDGGQIDLANAAGESMVSVGVNSGQQSASLHLRNTTGRSSVTLISEEGAAGRVVILDENGAERDC